MLKKSLIKNKNKKTPETFIFKIKRFIFWSINE